MNLLFAQLNNKIVKCKKCTRLVNFTKNITKKKRKKNINFYSSYYTVVVEPRLWYNNISSTIYASRRIFINNYPTSPSSLMLFAFVS